jgi:hypothetical protein
LRNVVLDQHSIRGIRAPGAIASVIRTAQTLIEEIIEALIAQFAAQAGAS